MSRRFSFVIPHKKKTRRHLVKSRSLLEIIRCRIVFTKYTINNQCFLHWSNINMELALTIMIPSLTTDLYYSSSPLKIGNVNLYLTAKIRIINTVAPQTTLETR